MIYPGKDYEFWGFFFKSSSDENTWLVFKPILIPCCPSYRDFASGREFSDWIAAQLEEEGRLKYWEIKLYKPSCLLLIVSDQPQQPFYAFVCFPATWQSYLLPPLTRKKKQRDKWVWKRVEKNESNRLHYLYTRMIFCTCWGLDKIFHAFFSSLWIWALNSCWILFLSLWISSCPLT